ncbi:MAG: tetraacyldisaccharide 4'-kinase [Desulfobulbaceae bacterium S3730MH12]|nr:MAG: tetraacyldisaccharide 4'-kinase [Desulfobulbaceae bacterium S5133MH15]OEU54677.1 MAG: tetraacyldisaccharide 4'-kinase [Desulfobulbaceae bacterium S3730MH12]
MNKIDFFFALGRPLSPLYSGLMSTRAAFYKKSIFKRHTLPVPVISIGNLTMGGSGKTPMVLSLARMLKQAGYYPAIISRGYGGKANKKSNTVSTGKKILLSQKEAGDEPFMLAKILEGVPVITGKSRIHPCKQAIESHDADILLLDDGFQHLAINRDIDIVLFNATTLAGNSRVFPGGVLREPVSALKRCHAFMLTGVTGSNRERADQFSILLKKKFPEKPLFFSKIFGYEVWAADEKESVGGFSDLGRTSGFCAIANPIRFQDSMEMNGIDLVQFSPFEDHRKYDQRLMDRLCNEAKGAGAQSLLTTEKDFVKIDHLKRTLPLYVLKVKQKEDKEFAEYILKTIQKYQ